MRPAASSSARVQWPSACAGRLFHSGWLQSCCFACLPWPRPHRRAPPYCREELASPLQALPCASPPQRYQSCCGFPSSLLRLSWGHLSTRRRVTAHCRGDPRRRAVSAQSPRPRLLAAPPHADDDCHPADTDAAKTCAVRIKSGLLYLNNFPVDMGENRTKATSFPCTPFREGLSGRIYAGV